MARVDRQTVDLSQYPDLVAIYLGMQVHSLRGLWALARLGLQIQRSQRARPDGLLLHEDFVFAQFPPHVAFRQYWRDYDTLEAWTRQLPHQGWWQSFLRDSKDTGFWHEAYSVRGGFEAVYDDMRRLPGLAAFAPLTPARGPLFSSRGRLRGAPSLVDPVIPEEALASD
ncbi:MAG: phenylacetaldoxime dehydratase family protein [Acidimicrobiia bacterium]